MNRSAVKIGQVLTVLTTGAIKIVGLASAFNQLLLSKHPTSLALAVSAFMMAGAQLSEGLILTALDRLVGNAEGRRREDGE
jgi:L-asparaginase II